MAQNIYDDPAFLDGYSRLPRQVEGLGGAPEWAALRAMLPDPAGLRVADLGCGFGWTARWLRAHGAATVLGIDLSESMLARARSMTDDDGVSYLRADLETLSLPEAAFDLAFSMLAFHYVVDFARLVGVIARSLAPGGSLVFSIEHPIFMAASGPDWIADQSGGRAWPVSGYAREGERVTDWFAPGVVKQHRMLSTTLNTLIEAGFALRRIEEYAPTAAQLAAMPALADEMERPMMLLVSASRTV